MVTIGVHNGTESLPSCSTWLLDKVRGEDDVPAVPILFSNADLDVTRVAWNTGARAPCSPLYFAVWTRGRPSTFWPEIVTQLITKVLLCLTSCVRKGPVLLKYSLPLWPHLIHPHDQLHQHQLLVQCCSQCHSSWNDEGRHDIAIWCYCTKHHDLNWCLCLHDDALRGILIAGGDDYTVFCLFQNGSEWKFFSSVQVTTFPGLLLCQFRRLAAKVFLFSLCKGAMKCFIFFVLDNMPPFLPISSWKILTLTFCVPMWSSSSQGSADLLSEHTGVHLGHLLWLVTLALLCLQGAPNPLLLQNLVDSWSVNTH